MSLKSYIFTFDFDLKFTFNTLCNRHCTPCTKHTAHLEHYILHPCTIRTACLAKYTLHTLYNLVLLVGCLNSIRNQILRVWSNQGSWIGQSRKHNSALISWSYQGCQWLIQNNSEKRWIRLCVGFSMKGLLKKGFKLVEVHIWQGKKVEDQII